MKGSLIWNLQRYSSLLILLYLLYVIGFIVNSEDQINFFTWSDFFLSFQSRIFTSLVCFLIVLHSFIGLWTVGTDYLTERTLGFLSKSLSKIAVLIQRTYLFTFIVLGIVYLIGVIVISTGFFLSAIPLAKDRSTKSALLLLKASVYYLPLLLTSSTYCFATSGILSTLTSLPPLSLDQFSLLNPEWLLCFGTPLQSDFFLIFI